MKALQPIEKSDDFLVKIDKEIRKEVQRIDEYDI